MSVQSPTIDAVQPCQADPPNTIPAMTDPHGRYWDQPDRAEITIDGTHALMSLATRNLLHCYDASYPSGVYPGKMWRRQELHNDYLVWYGNSAEVGMCSVNVRRILVVD